MCEHIPELKPSPAVKKKKIQNKITPTNIKNDKQLKRKMGKRHENSLRKTYTYQNDRLKTTAASTSENSGELRLTNVGDL